jgi:opacity protein-like surface antigen
MMKRMWRQGTGVALAGALAVGFFAPATAEAQVFRVSGSEPRQSLVFHLGYFSVRGEDARVADDTLVINLEGLAFDISDFNGAIIGGDWIFPLGEWLDGSVGASFYRRTVPSVYRDVVRGGGGEIEQDLRLRMVPMTAMVRFLPAGRGGAIEPYVGGGITLVNWRYSEVGEFVDFAFDPPDIFRNQYVANGNALGGVILAGLRAPVADVWTVGGEVRYQRVEGDTDAITSGLLGDKIDLGGWSANFTLGVRF